MLDIDMLDCYVYAVFSIIMYVLHFLYAGFGGSPAREADKTGKKNLKKSYVHRLCSSGH
jgi:hypothetical protein